MEWLNYHHLLYFWMVAREGGLGPAALKLRLSAPTLSSQIKTLETAIGEELFFKRGRRLALTETGEVVYRYAEEIFSLGTELLGALRGGLASRPARLVVGVSQSVPKLIARRILEPLDTMEPRIRLVCREEPPARLLAELAAHALDVVLTDAPSPVLTHIKVFSHLLGESALAIVAAEPLASRYRSGFPKSLEGAPFLLPTEPSVTRRALLAWFDQVGVRPNIVGEFDDSALLKSFAQGGLGLFAAPAVIQREIKHQYGVHRVGLASGVKERFYALTCERRLKHPALVEITEAARVRLFRPPPSRRGKARGLGTE